MIRPRGKSVVREGLKRCELPVREAIFSLSGASNESFDAIRQHTLVARFESLLA